MPKQRWKWPKNIFDVILNCIKEIKLIKQVEHVYDKDVSEYFS